jgi:hypothetical protein
VNLIRSQLTLLDHSLVKGRKIETGAAKEDEKIEDADEPFSSICVREYRDTYRGVCGRVYRQANIPILPTYAHLTRTKIFTVTLGFSILYFQCGSATISVSSRLERGNIVAPKSGSTSWWFSWALRVVSGVISIS